jgi:hypothetical protein
MKNPEAKASGFFVTFFLIARSFKLIDFATTAGRQRHCTAAAFASFKKICYAFF